MSSDPVQNLVPNRQCTRHRQEPEYQADGYRDRTDLVDRRSEGFPFVEDRYRGSCEDRDKEQDTYDSSSAVLDRPLMTVFGRILRARRGHSVHPNEHRPDGLTGTRYRCCSTGGAISRESPSKLASRLGSSLLTCGRLWLRPMS